MPGLPGLLRFVELCGLEEVLTPPPQTHHSGKTQYRPVTAIFGTVF